MRPSFPIAVVVCVVLMRVPSTAQHLSSSRGIGLGASTALLGELSSIDWNASGLIDVKDWEITATNFTLIGEDFRNPRTALHTAGISKRFLENSAIGFRYSPGLSLEFVVPSTFQFEGSQKIAFDKKIAYREPYGFGYAHRFDPMLTLGISGRYLDEKVIDTQPFIEQDTVASIREVEYAATSWNMDIGIRFTPDDRWKFGLVAKNLFRLVESSLPGELHSFALRTVKSLRGGIGFTPVPWAAVSLDMDTEGQGALGAEWDLSPWITVRQGLYFGVFGSPSLDALSLGIGSTVQSVRLDISLVHFTNAKARSSVTLSDFLREGVKDIGYNQFTPSQVTMTVAVPLGRTRSPLAKIEHVQILSEVFPSSYQIHAYRALGRARVRNLSDGPIEAKIAFFVKSLMDSPTETRGYPIMPGEETEIPFTAVFNETITAVQTMVLRAAEVYVRASPVDDFDDRFQTQVIVRGRNDWDGNVLSLRYFVTPGDPEVLRFTRAILNQYKDSLAEVEPGLNRFRSAATLFDEFARRLVYVGDPRTSKDHVQFPSETLSLRGGDCDDLSVCFATILSSMNIATAFVDVIPPDRPHEAHIYLLFDTGVPVAHAGLVSANPKRYVVRTNEHGAETIWIPLETTVITEGFEKAWDVGAQEYYQDVEVGLGVQRGWVKIVDIVPQ